MAQPITDYAAFFAEAKQAVTELSQLKEDCAKLEEEEKRLERELQAKRRAVADAIDLTLKRRSGEIADSYDKELERAQDRLKKIHAKREKAKNQGVRERIEEDTLGLVKENRELKDQIKTLFKRNQTPGFCRSGFYYSLYLTRGVREALTLFLTVLICFLIVPCGVYLLLPEKKSLYLAAIYVADIMIFGGLYVVVGNKTKMRHLDTLKEGRAIRNKMRANEREIREIAKTIRKDRNESQYNLEKFDDEIAQLEQDMTQIANQKKEALNTFDTVTRTIISDEIMANNKESVDKMESDLESATEGLKETHNAIKEKSLSITDRYEIYVGKEFMTAQKLDALSGIMNAGAAANLSEAIEVYQRGWNPAEEAEKLSAKAPAEAAEKPSEVPAESAKLPAKAPSEIPAQGTEPEKNEE